MVDENANPNAWAIEYEASASSGSESNDDSDQSLAKKPRALPTASVNVKAAASNIVGKKRSIGNVDGVSHQAKGKPEQTFSSKIKESIEEIGDPDGASIDALIEKVRGKASFGFSKVKLNIALCNGVESGTFVVINNRYCLGLRSGKPIAETRSDEPVLEASEFNLVPILNVSLKGKSIVITGTFGDTDRYEGYAKLTTGRPIVTAFIEAAGGKATSKISSKTGAC